MTALLQFVDQIGSSPTVRLDLNTAPWTAAVDGFDFSPPPMVKSYAASILNDGAALNASAYDNRVLTIPLDLAGSLTDDQKATSLRALAVELNRQSNIIRYQPGTTPLFFRTFRSPEFRLTESPVPNYTRVLCVIEAEPFAYGLRVDQAGVSVSADPSLTNGCYVDVNSVTGDVATPAFVKLSANTSAAATAYLAVRRHGTPSAVPLVFQAESAASANVALAGSHDATASGAGNNYKITNAVESTFATRLTFSVGASGDEIRGTYRALIRVKQSVSGDTWALGLKAGSLGPQITSTVSTSGTSGWVLVDLGLVQIPFDGPDLLIGYSGVATSVKSDYALTLLAGRTSGSGELSFDYLQLLPADEELTVITAAWQGTSAVILDGPNDTAYRVEASTNALNSAYYTTAGIPRMGSLPLLSPGSNRLYLVQGAAVTDSSTVAVSYWPRYLTV